ncbi:cytochrome C552 [Shewanella sp. WE21]|uniref:c-type cytochrome n=1 Tax=Shewanella sp. WE21 TaxID=2029986 RepID=UPI000CF6DAA5|nr:c-type cytochrome [Shewanella sp. WE21]AVI65862.1 cytochrome C552 [Shewanella sp. WE21]
MSNNVLIILGFVSVVINSASIAEPVMIKLPADTSTLKFSTLPGYIIAEQKCNICHSSNYISYQPPGMTQAQWTAEMHKMHQNYGAPINEQQINSLGAYLSVAYGSAKMTDENIIEASKKVEEVKSSGPVNVQALLKDNSCLSCHGLDHRVVGPGYNEVAAKYKSVLDAKKIVAENIQNGGSGRWGAIPMPPMTGLSETEAKALAEFILSQ